MKLQSQFSTTTIIILLSGMVILGAYMLSPLFLQSNHSIFALKGSSNNQGIKKRHSVVQSTFEWQRNIENELALLKNQLKVLTKENQHFQRQIQLYSENSLQNEKAVNQDSTAEEPNEVRHNGNPFDDFKDKFINEKRDHHWANDSENRIHNFFDSEGLNDSTLNHAECRNSMCLFDVSHDSSETQIRFIEQSLQDTGFDAGLINAGIDEDGIPFSQIIVLRRDNNVVTQ